MKLLSRFNVSRENNGPRKFSFEISMSGVISVGIVVVLGMCWVFILGILVGRGYRPEAAVPQIAQMMPTTEATLPDNTTSSAPPSVLKPEELQFMDLQEKDGEVVADSTQKSSADGKKSPPIKSRDLTDSRSAPMGSAVAATSVAAIPAKNAPHPSLAPIPVAKAVPTPKAPAEDAHAAKTKVDPKAPFEKTSRYTATYQVASFPAREQADTLVKNLAKKGITASIQEAKSNKSAVFRVNIQIKGTEADIAEGLKKTGEKGPILLGKKPL